MKRSRLILGINKNEGIVLEIPGVEPVYIKVNEIKPSGVRVSVTATIDVKIKRDAICEPELAARAHRVGLAP